MLNVFESLLDFVKMIATYVSNMFSGFQFLMDSIADSFITLSYVSAYIPSGLLGFALAGLSICVVFQILGR